ncbi:MAG: hypothetical protein ABR524_09630, partial [Thermoanaerobaculia bacterium]
MALNSLMLPRPTLVILLPLLLIAIPVTAQFPILPAGPGAATGNVSSFELLPFEPAPRVLWTQPTSSWIVSLTENLEPRAPEKAGSGLVPSEAARVGDVTVVVGECHPAGGVCLDRYADDGSLLGTLLLEARARSPRVASLGNEALVAFVDLDSGHHLDLVRLGGDGLPRERMRLGPVVTDAPPALAAANGSFYVGWNDG